MGTPGSWQVISGANDIDYTDRPQLDTEDDRWYRRIVFSGPAQVCKDTATPLAIDGPYTDHGQYH